MTTDTTIIGASEEYGSPLGVAVRWPHPGGAGSYGYRRSATHHHQGVDLVAARGTPWLAFAAGIVTHVVTAPTPSAGFAGYGRVVVVRHKDLASGRYVYALYAHGDAVTVAVGQHVEQGHELGKVGNSQFARHPTRPEGRMGAHLHWELSTHAYPQGSEAPTRVDPVHFLRSHDVPGMPAAPSSTSDQATADRAPSPADQDLPAKYELRRALMARLAQTDVRITLYRAELVRAGHPMVAEALGSAWAPSRARLWALLSAPSRLAEVHAAVTEWLTRIEDLAVRARAIVPEAMRDAVERVRRELRDIWERGIDWTTQSLADLGRQVLGAGLMGGSALLILAALWAFSKTR